MLRAIQGDHPAPIKYLLMEHQIWFTNPDQLIRGWWTSTSVLAHQASLWKTQSPDISTTRLTSVLFYQQLDPLLDRYGLQDDLAIKMKANNFPDPCVSISTIEGQVPQLVVKYFCFSLHVCLLSVLRNLLLSCNRSSELCFSVIFWDFTTKKCNIQWWQQ